MLGIKSLLSAGETALVLGISEETVKELARMGELPCEYKKRQPYFTVEELVAYFKQQEEAA